MLSKEEKERYGRHLILEGFGEEAQLKLKKAKPIIKSISGAHNPIIFVNFLTVSRCSTCRWRNPINLIESQREQK